MSQTNDMVAAQPGLRQSQHDSPIRHQVVVTSANTSCAVAEAWPLQKPMACSVHCRAMLLKVALCAASSK